MIFKMMMMMMMMEIRMNQPISSRDLTIKDLHHRKSPTRHNQDYGMHVLSLVPSTTRTLSCVVVCRAFVNQGISLLRSNI